jgi:hypothetical protein
MSLRFGLQPWEMQKLTPVELQALEAWLKALEGTPVG